MKPSVGRIVHFIHGGRNIAAAIVTRVHSDTCVNLYVFFDAAAEARTSVCLGTSDGDWMWPERVA